MAIFKKSLSVHRMLKPLNGSDVLWLILRGRKSEFYDDDDDFIYLWLLFQNSVFLAELC